MDNDVLEQRIISVEKRVKALEEKENDRTKKDVSDQITITMMSKDIEYIKLSVDKLCKQSEERSKNENINVVSWLKNNFVRIIEIAGIATAILKAYGII